MITLFIKNENKDLNNCRCSRIIHSSYLTLNDRESNELSLSGGEISYCRTKKFSNLKLSSINNDLLYPPFK